MMDSQLYLAIGISTLAVLLGILTNVIQWNAIDARFNSLESRFNSLDVKLDTLTGKVIDVDDLVTHLEAKLGIG
jgi:hypothetical protein